MIRPWPGIIAAVLVALLSVGTLAAVIFRADGWGGLTANDWAAVRFTLLQAGISAGLSVALAIPVARALARQNFPGKPVLVTLLGAPFILPVIVAVLGLLAIFGRGGAVNGWLVAVGLPPLSIYGLQGVVLAHVFFNLPLATRIILQGWSAIPAERFRLAASLGFGPRDTARLLERPMLGNVLPGAVMLIFVICTTSFAVVLALGGGPKATTVELAIYQAFRFDFDLGKAALLAVVQFGICALAAAVMFRVQVPLATGGGLDRPSGAAQYGAGRAAFTDAIWIGFAMLFLLAPLGMVVANGVAGLSVLPPGIGAAAMRSLVVAFSSTLVMLGLALPMSFAIVSLRNRSASRLVEGVGYLSIAASPLVVGTGLFIVIFPFADPVALALPVTALVNAMMALPFALRVLVPAVAEIDQRFGALAHSIGLDGWAQIRVLFLPRLRRPLGFATGLAAALSMGDLGVIALFSDPEQATLPLQLYRLMASYRMEQAGAAALILLAMSLAVFWVFDRGGRIDADT